MKAPQVSRAKDVFLDYWKHTIRYPGLFFCLVFFGLAIQAAVVAAPLYLKEFVDILTTTEPGEAGPALMRVLAFFAVFTFAAWGFRRVEFYFLARIESRVMADLTVSAFNYTIKHSYHFFISNFVGSLVRRVTRYARSYETMLDAIFLQIYPLILMAIGIVVILSMRNLLLGIGLAVWTIMFVTIQIWLVRLVHKYRLRAAEEDSNVTGVLSDALTNHATATLFSGIPYEKKRFAESTNILRFARFRAWRADDNVWAVQGVLMASVNVALLYGAMVLWQRGLLSVGDFVLIQTYLLTLFERLVQTGRELRQMFVAAAEATEMSDILKLPHEIHNAPGAVPLKVSDGVIEFKNVVFKYHEGHAALDSLNARIEGGEKVALVGPSGAGKTTVTKILLRLYNIDEGEVLVDGQNIANVTLESLREAVSFVPQEPLLFHRPLIENIRYGRQDATDDEVIAAAKKANCHDFILSLPHKYDTLVGERGIKLSGGERQRIAIARAILKDAPILVLDEATSSLDSESEQLIQEALETLMEGKTVIVIAHRLSTIVKMDRIIVVEEGKVAAEGTHDELLSQAGRYRTLWNIQAGGFLDDKIKGGEGV